MARHEIDRDAPHPRRRQVAWAALLVLAPLWASSCLPASTASAGSVDAPEPPQAVRVVPVTAQTLQEQVRYVGTVQGEVQLTVRSRIAGTVTELAVAEGEPLAADQRIALLSAPELQARIDQVRAELTRAKTEQAYLCDRHATDRALADAGALPAAQLDLGRKLCRTGAAGVASARARLEEVEAAQVRTVERSPRDGTVLRVLAEPGEHVGPGQPLVVLEGGRRELLVRVIEDDIERGVRVGTPVILQHRRRPPQRGSVARVDPAASGPGRVFDVVIALPDALTDLSTGVSIDASFVLAEEHDATPVPVHAVRRIGERAVVYLVDDGVAHEHTVIEGIVDAGMVSVRPALPVGAQVAITNLEALRDGQPVYAVPAPGGLR